MTSCLQNWPEPIVRVQSLSESGIRKIPQQYVKNLSGESLSSTVKSTDGTDDQRNIPVIDMSQIFSSDTSMRASVFLEISNACREWGFFQIVNHDVDHDLLNRVLEVWGEFFNLPMEEKQKYANSPMNYEGYGSRLGVEKGASLDWSDYFFLYFSPSKNMEKWPRLPVSCREIVEKYGKEMAKLCGKLTSVLSINLGLHEEYLQNAFGGENNGACLRVNYYPKCPQPDLTLGLSPHSDPGGMTVILPNDNLAALQVRKGGSWVTVKPLPNALIVNIGDQLQVLSNATYKSVEHRVMVNQAKERVSLAFFYNPRSDILIQPAKKLVTAERPALYPAMTYSEYRRFITTKGLCGKFQVESLASPR